MALVRVALPREVSDADLVPDCLLSGPVVVVGHPLEMGVGCFALDCIEVGGKDR